MGNNNQINKGSNQLGMQQQQSKYQIQQPQGSSQSFGILQQQNPQESDIIQKKLVSHIQNRLKIKQMYKDKGIQMLDKPEQMISDIQEPQLDPTQSLAYNIIKTELSEKGFSDFKYIGQGKQGLVFLAKELSTNRRFAIKGLHVRDSQGKIFQETFDQAQQEINMLEKCKGSTYVVNLLKKIEGKEFIYLVLSECQGTLSELIEKSPNKKLNELSAIKYAKDIAEGLLHIHSQKCISNDLKMDNILIDYNGNAVVSDLGLADSLTKTSGYGMNQYLGNWLFQAPECYDPNKFQDYADEYQKLGLNISTKPTIKSECFSLGYLIYLMVQDFKSTLMFKKHLPLNYSNEFEQFTYKNQLKFIINGLTQFKPEDRLSIKDVLIILKGIISFEFQLDQKFIEFMDDHDQNTQQFIRKFKKDIEFVQNSSQKFYPIIKKEQDFIQEILSKQQQGQDAIISQLRQSNIQLEQQIKSLKDIQKQLENELKALRNQKVQLEATTVESNQTIILLKQEIEKLKQTQKTLENDLKAQSNQKQNIQNLNQFQPIVSQQEIQKKEEEEALKKQKQKQEQEKQIQLQKAQNKQIYFVLVNLNSINFYTTNQK
ncbi:kinase domain protein (macronuclear) [Tetrahymena thermophila SB210]|uniref:Kinase domain protein n=1 Tax=Tetrahymena thermophila (strain SB210) TaxID=312017 RepID=Q227Y3_TETTS|nr:kinase domain protein [Tetrahymena thermophila SB210]EAR81600.3 kinase domain protein [Tetrahymena thermophila SB210]|eukprot:XP_001029263.3 kinase domain protein [Tetrahymena thermophila SB210]